MGIKDTFALYVLEIESLNVQMTGIIMNINKEMANICSQICFFII